MQKVISGYHTTHNEVPGNNPIKNSFFGQFYTPIDVAGHTHTKKRV